MMNDMAATAPADTRPGVKYADHAQMLLADQLRDGRFVFIRSLRTTDAEMLRETLPRLSPLSRYRRFMTGVSDFTDAELDYFTNIDGIDHSAFGAMIQQPDGSRIGAGTARYIRSEEDPEEAEFAVTIADDCQRLGIATMLMDVLTRHAKHNGIRRFTAVMLAENTPIHELVRSRGGVIEQTDEPTIVTGYIDIC